MSQQDKERSLTFPSVNGFISKPMKKDSLQMIYGNFHKQLNEPSSKIVTTE